MRFKPDNIICSARETNIVFIIDKETGKLSGAWGRTIRERNIHIGWIIGQHHAHLIPDGLPGAGNLLLFDNGGWAGYGSPHETSKTGEKSAQRDHSRVLEINPFTLDIIWQYSLNDFGNPFPAAAHHFYSPLMSSAQRLPNGNTLICEGNDGRIFEVTCEHEIVWEYMNPHFGPNGPITYRAYRLPYEWIPQLPKPEEVPVQPPDNKVFRVPAQHPVKLNLLFLWRGQGIFPCFKSYAGGCCTNCNLGKMPTFWSIQPELCCWTKMRRTCWASPGGAGFLGSERCRHCKEVYKLLLADSGRTGHGKP